VLDAIFYVVRGRLAWAALPVGLPFMTARTGYPAGGPLPGRGRGFTTRCAKGLRGQPRPRRRAAMAHLTMIMTMFRHLVSA
jgi:hypothetical protein